MKGPWGGGNLFVINLANYLTEKGHVVVFSLLDNDIDLILMTDPRGIRKRNHLLLVLKKYGNIKNM